MTETLPQADLDCTFIMATRSSQLVNIPIFVCMRAAFPEIPWRIEICDERQRRMVQRCIDSGSLQFGVCTSTAISAGEPFSDFGTVVTIKNQIVKEDGRLVIDALGCRRFWIVDRCMQDFYYTANVAFISDEIVKREKSTEKLKSLSRRVYEVIYEWYTSLDFPAKEKVKWIAGDMPSYDVNSDPNIHPHGPAWVWWAFAARQTEVEPSVVVGCPYLEERLLMLIQESESEEDESQDLDAMAYI